MRFVVVAPQPPNPRNGGSAHGKWRVRARALACVRACARDTWFSLLPLPRKKETLVTLMVSLDVKVRLHPPTPMQIHYAGAHTGTHTGTHTLTRTATR